MIQSRVLKINLLKFWFIKSFMKSSKSVQDEKEYQKIYERFYLYV